MTLAILDMYALGSLALIQVLCGAQVMNCRHCTQVSKFQTLEACNKIWSKIIVNNSGPSLLVVCKSKPVFGRLKVNTKHLVNYFKKWSRIVLIYIYIYIYICRTSIAVPLQAWSGPAGSRKSIFPDFMTTAQDGGKVVSLTHRPHLPPGNAPGTHFCQRLSRSQGHSAIGRILCQRKIPMTPVGIEPATFRFVTQHLNHCVVTWTVEGMKDGTSRCWYLLAYVNHTTVTVTTEGQH